MKNSDPAAAKKAIRARIKNIRAGLSADTLKALGSQVCARLRQLPCWQAARSVALYHALPGEVPTGELLAELWADSAALQKTVWLPRVLRPASAGLMEFVPCQGPENLRPGPFGLLEPAPDLPGLQLAGPDTGPVAGSGKAPDLYIVPGLAFDRRGGRLGFGGGYYDRWLAAVRGQPGNNAEIQSGQAEAARPLFVGLCFGFQILPELPLEPWDCRMDYLCNEEETICL